MVGTSRHIHFRTYFVNVFSFILKMEVLVRPLHLAWHNLHFCDFVLGLINFWFGAVFVLQLEKPA